MTYCEPYILEE